MVVFSCSDSSELTDNQSDANKRALCKSSVYTEGTNQTRSIDSDGNLQEIFTSGYTSVSNGKNLKLLFSTDLAKATGLEAKTVYITRYETYYNKISLAGMSFFDDEHYEGCGLREKHTIDGSYLSYTERGYHSRLIGTTQVELETHLVHVISDMSGHKLDIYYPCTPDKIKWHYILFKENI